MAQLTDSPLGSTCVAQINTTSSMSSEESSRSRTSVSSDASVGGRTTQQTKHSGTLRVKARPQSVVNGKLQGNVFVLVPVTSEKRDGKDVGLHTGISRNQEKIPCNGQEESDSDAIEVTDNAPMKQDEALGGGNSAQRNASVNEHYVSRNDCTLENDVTVNDRKVSSSSNAVLQVPFAGWKPRAADAGSADEISHINKSLKAGETCLRPVVKREQEENDEIQFARRTFQKTSEQSQQSIGDVQHERAFLSVAVVQEKGTPLYQDERRHTDSTLNGTASVEKNAPSVFRDLADKNCLIYKSLIVGEACQRPNRPNQGHAYSSGRAMHVLEKGFDRCALCHKKSARSASGATGIICAACEKSCASASIRGRLLLRCFQCGKRFGDKHALGLHVKDHEGEVPRGELISRRKRSLNGKTGATTMAHRCEQCGEHFANKTKLTLHLRKHVRDQLGRTTDKSRKQPQTRPHHRSKTQPHQRSQTPPNHQPQTQSESNCGPQTQPHEQPQKRPHERPQPQPIHRPQPQPNRRPQTLPHQRPQPQPNHRLQTLPHQQPQPQPNHQPQIQPNYKPQIQPNYKPKTQPKYRPRTQSQHRPHQALDLVYACDVCPKRFGQKQLLATHMTTHTRLQLFECSRCFKTFNSSNELCKHRCQPGADPRPFKCPICGQSFANKSNRHRHVVSVHSENQTYKCSECGKKFKTESDRDLHTRIHMGAKPYACCFCEDAFSECSELAEHLKTHRG